MKNKIILGLILGIFLIGLVSAGTLIKVREGETANIEGTQISVSKITGNALFGGRRTANIDVKMPAPMPIKTNLTNCTTPWLNQTGNFTLSLKSSAGNFTINSSGVYVWAAQKGFKFATDGNLNMNLLEAKSGATLIKRVWNCNRGWLDNDWLCNVLTN